MRTSCTLVSTLLVAGCHSEDPRSCRSAADCQAEEHCLLDDDRGEGRCLATPGIEAEPVPLRWFPHLSHTTVLFVVDDGPSAVELQARLIASLDAMVDRARASHDDLRVAVTSTSVEDSLCEPVAAASHGQISAISCLDRLDDFIGADGTDARGLCTDHCAYTTEQLGPMTGPWVDLWDLPDDVDPAGALACVVPQGISGCRHAAPAEAARRAVFLAQMDTSENFGLFRGDFFGEIVMVTDGVDCSLTELGTQAFDPEGDRALWSDPNAAEATAAVCWNAGVSCTGDPLDLECETVDRGLDGMPVTGTDPVLFESGRYEGLFDPDSLSLHVIAGVPVGDPREPAYSTVGDPAWLLEHGIDPGCSDGTITALPPVRLRDAATALTSVCEADYTAPLEGLFELQTTCLLTCGASISVEYEPPNEAPRPIPECEGTAPVYTVSAGAPACYLLREDSERCNTEGQVELVLLPADPGHSGAFLLDPNPWAPSFPGCTP